MHLKGGPTCAEESWRFIFNFAEWGLIFFVIYLLATLTKLKIGVFGSKTT